ncbi:MAG: sulfotransferase [Hyphomonas sp.]
MAKNHWLVSGVGRSGTTMAYSALLAAARAQDPGTLGRYEPFLWGAPTWDKLPGDIGDAFSRTDSINARGVYAHTESPLFHDASHPALDSFIDETLPVGRPVVAKVIRGAGRLGAFLERDPDLKIVHLIRNPLDVVNSALLYFSFFGGEFHPSDEPRFNVEAAARFGDMHRPTFELTEAERSLEWWRLMNEAAYQSAQRFPKRLKIVPYEHLMADLPGVMTGIVEFLGGSANLIDASGLSENVGPVTRWTSLQAVDRDAILPHVDAYFDDLRIFGVNRNPVDIAAMKARLLEKYAACKAGPAFTPQLEPSLAPTRVRSIAVKARQDADASRAAGDKQADRIAEKVSERTGSGWKDIAAALARQSEQIAGTLKASEDRDAGITSLAAELSEKKDEIGALKRTLDSRDARVIDLEAKLKEAKTHLSEAKREGERDLQASHQLNSRLRDRIAALQDEQSSHTGAFEKLRFEKRDVEDKLRKTENRLRTVAGERELYRQQLVELASVLAPRLSTVVTLRPLRYVMRQRQRVKSGMVEIDENGVPRLKTSK